MTSTILYQCWSVVRRELEEDCPVEMDLDIKWYLWEAG
jgi:hypothetical protein